MKKVMRQINWIVLHCTAASGAQPQQNVLDYWRSMGWKSNGYHWLINDSGIAVRLQGDEFVANGVRGINATAIHICYQGGWNEKDTRTPIQKEAMAVLVEDYKKKYPNTKIRGHRDFSPDLNKNGIIERHEWIKICPCFDAQAEFSYLK